MNAEAGLVVNDPSVNGYETTVRHGVDTALNKIVLTLLNMCLTDMLA